MDTSNRLRAKRSASRLTSTALLISAIALGLLAATCRAQADLKITMTVVVTPQAQTVTDDEGQTTTTSAPPQVTRTVTIYSKGKYARVDGSDGQSTIFDGKLNKVIVMKPADGTYYSVTLKQWQTYGAAVQVPPGGAPPTPQTSATLSPTDDIPGNARTVSGLETRKYLLTASLTASANSPRHRGGGGGGRGGERGGGLGGIFGGLFTGNSEDYGYGGNGGGSGGGDDSGSGDSTYYGPLRELGVSGEVWLPRAKALSPDASNPLLADAISSQWSLGALTETVALAMVKQGEIPMYSNLFLTRSSRSQGDRSVSVEMEVTAISQEPVGDSLFELPQTYTEVLVPTATPDGSTNPNPGP